MKRHNASILKAVFKRRGEQTSNSGNFDHLSDSIKSYFSEYLLNDEIPILCEKGVSSWALLTERRLLWENGDGQRKSIDLNRLINASVNLLASTRLGARKKIELSVLRLMLSDGSHFELQLEAGPSFWGWLNVLTTIVAKNKAIASDAKD